MRASPRVTIDRSSRLGRIAEELSVRTWSLPFDARKRYFA